MNFEYKMPEKMYYEYLKGCSKTEQPNTYMCKIVNSEFGIKGNCIKVIPY